MILRGATAWITGAGKGIGEAIAVSLARNGVRVALTSRTSANVDAVKKRIEAGGGAAIAVPGDVSLERDVERVSSEVLRAFGGLDILVNNAGIGRFAPVSAMSIEDFDRMWGVNVRGVFLCTRAVLPAMQKKKAGVIVNISSLAGKNAFVNGAGYAASKWALNGFSNCLRLEVRSEGIKVVTVCPGSVATDFSAKAKDSDRTARILAPEDVAEAVLAALALPDRAMMSEIDIRPTNPA